MTKYKTKINKRNTNKEEELIRDSVRNQTKKERNKLKIPPILYLLQYSISEKKRKLVSSSINKT